MKWNKWQSKALLGAALAAAACACSLIVDSETAQCKTTADCVGKGAAFAGLVCGPNGVCVGQGGCSTNKECIDANKGQAFVCNKTTRSCVDLSPTFGTDKPVCTPAASPEDIANDNTVWLGVMYNDVGPDSSYGNAMGHLPLLAANEIKTGTGPLPPASPGGPGRPLAIEVCNTSAIQDLSVKSGLFLAKDLAVPAVIGPIGALFGVTYQQALGPSKVLTFTQTVGEIAALDSTTPRTLFSMFGAATESTSAGASSVANLVEVKIRENLGLASSAPIRVAVVNQKDTLDQSTATRLVQTMQFNNGKSASVNQDEGNFFLTSYNSDATQSEYDGVTKALREFQPHIVITIGFGEVGPKIMGPVETQWNASLNYHPIWVLPSPAPLSAEMFALMNTEAGKKTNLYRRVLTAAASYDTPGTRATNVAYGSEFPDDPALGDLSLLGFAFVNYDITYALAYVIAANGAAPVTGANLAKQFLAIQSANGPEITVGPADLYRGFQAVTGASPAMKLKGLVLRFDFDIEKGYPPVHTDLSGIMCVKRDGRGAATGLYVHPNTSVDNVTFRASASAPFDCGDLTDGGTGGGPDGGTDGG